MVKHIFIIEDDPIMARCYQLALEKIDQITCQIFSDAIQAMSALSEQLPDLIILDILLSGPDGFTFLNELSSYSDTMSIPVILISSLDLTNQDLAHYGVQAIFHKDALKPAQLRYAVKNLLFQSGQTPLLSNHICPTSSRSTTCDAEAP